METQKFLMIQNYLNGLAQKNVQATREYGFIVDVEIPFRRKGWFFIAVVDQATIERNS